jgi:pentatricopeptide repeat protein
MCVACAKGNMWRKALSLLDEMRQSGIEPTGFTYSAAISACGNGGQWERGLELLYQVGYPFSFPNIHYFFYICINNTFTHDKTKHLSTNLYIR